ncbi:hypothetical protein, partial [Nocardia noduli]|uniref:hypothetical protein n=1 Tax=Nocardia noduli TaxID=2815722 RepID=UPI001C2119A3
MSWFSAEARLRRVQGWFDEGNVRRLHQEFRRWNTPQALSALTGIMASGPDGSASQARDVLEQLGVDPEALAGVINCVVTGENEKLSRARQFGCGLTPAAVSFLLAPAPNPDRFPYKPKVRLMEYLSSNRNTRALTDSLTAVVSDTTENPARGNVAGFLSSTDHPALLEALEARFDDLIAEALTQKHDERHHRRVTVGAPEALRRLWTPQGQPTPFTQILLDNPFLSRHLGPWPETRRYASQHYAARARFLEAVVHNRMDLVLSYEHEHGPAQWVQDLLEAAQLGAPPEITARCEQVLRGLDHGQAREALCDIAVNEYAPHTDYAREIARATGYTWSSERRRAVFLFLTEQWDRYDELDPDGAELRAYCDHDKTLSPTQYRPYCRRIAEIAVRTQHFNPRDADFWNSYTSTTGRPEQARGAGGVDARSHGGNGAGFAGSGCGGGGGGCGGGGGGG